MSQLTRIPVSERPRKVDLNKLSKDQVDAISEKLGKEINNILETAINAAANLLSIYGLALVINYNILPEDELHTLAAKSKKKSTKKKSTRSKKVAKNTAKTTKSKKKSTKKSSKKTSKKSSSKSLKKNK